MSGTVIAGLNWVGLVLISVIALTMIIGIARGLVKTLISIITWVAAAYLAYKYAGEFTHYIESFITNAEVRLWIMRIAIFVLVMIVGALVGNILHQLVSVGGARGFDRVLGLVLGAVLGVVIASILILASGLTDFPQTDIFKSSVMVPKLMELVNYLREFLPEAIQQEIHFPTDSVAAKPAILSGDGQATNP